MYPMAGFFTPGHTQSKESAAHLSGSAPRCKLPKIMGLDLQSGPASDFHQPLMQIPWMQIPPQIKSNQIKSNQIKYLSLSLRTSVDPTNKDTNFCKYYETDNFVKSNFNTQSNLSILHLNVASLQFHLRVY